MWTMTNTFLYDVNNYQSNPTYIIAHVETKNNGFISNDSLTYIRLHTWIYGVVSLVDCFQIPPQNFAPYLPTCSRSASEDWTIQVLIYLYSW